jgi:hypothetical protein
MILMPVLAPFLRSTKLFTSGRKPLAAVGRINSFRADLDRPVWGHLWPGRGNLQNSGRVGGISGSGIPTPVVVNKAI